MSRIDKVELNIRDLSASLRRQIRQAGRRPVRGETIEQKSFGEKPPRRADISKDPYLSFLFSRRGLVGWLEEKIRRASKHQGKIIPAHDITAMAMPHLPEQQEGNLVFLGVEFVQEKSHDPDLLAGVLCHEWGHLTSDFLQGIDPNQLPWQEVHELRKEEEGYADAYAGRLLYLIGHKPDGLIRHFRERSPEGGTAKYHDIETREAIIRTAWQVQAEAHQKAAKLLSEPGTKSQLTARIIAIA